VKVKFHGNSPHRSEQESNYILNKLKDLARNDVFRVSENSMGKKYFIDPLEALGKGGNSEVSRRTPRKDGGKKRFHLETETGKRREREVI